MGKSDEARLLALLEDIDWTTLPAEDDEFWLLPRLPKVLPRLVKAALTTSAARAGTLVFKATGTSQFGVFADYPIHGADVYTRLLPEASSVGVSWLLSELRTTAHTLVIIDAFPDSWFDEFSAFVLARRRVIDDAIGDDVDRLRSVAEIATLIEADDWKADLVDLAQALGAADSLQRLTALPKWSYSEVRLARVDERPAARTRLVSERRLQRPYPAEPLEPIHVRWNRGPVPHDALLYERWATVSAGHRAILRHTELRSDRQALAALGQSIRRELEAAAPMRKERPPRWREVVVRGWIGDDLKEVRYRWSDPIEPFMGARRWSEFLSLLEPPRR